MRNIRCKKSILLEPYLNSNIDIVIEHCKRVAVILEIISQPVLDRLLEAYGLANTVDNKSNMSKCMYLAGKYHDIGMVSVPKEVLRKNQVYSKDEYEIMHRHAEHGKMLIESALKEDSFKKRLFVDVAYNHHERYDGSGYPNGISKEDIPLAAQLCAIADSFDSMTTYRNYKDTMTLRQANEELIKNKGILYSPLAIDAFVDMFSRIDELYNLRKSYLGR